MIKFCSLYSGSSGNSIFLSTGKTKILIDCGLSCKKIAAALASIGENPSELSAILVSHEHVDHIRGAGVVSRKFGVPVYANRNTWDAMESSLGPIPADRKMEFEGQTEFYIGDVLVRTFPIPHDAVEPVGFNFFAGDKKITIATDIGHINRKLLDYIMESDLILIESNHDLEMLKVGRYPWSLKRRIMGDKGHLSNDMAAKVVAYMAEKGTKNFVLGHLSKENNFPQLAYQTVYNALNEKCICAGQDVVLEVALRDSVGKVIEI
jgi:phosphoribosyl 1,2-cyclic phosphodiesterase